MSIDSFIRDPLGYSKTHIVQFSHGSADVSPQAAAMTCISTMNNWAGNWTAEEYALIPGQFTGFEFVEGLQAGTGARIRIGKGASKMHSVKCVPVNQDLGVRFLPWKPNCVTYMALDNNATRFFTGPLSGCCIYIGDDANGVPYVFHANRNNSGGGNNLAINTPHWTSPTVKPWCQ